MDRDNFYIILGLDFDKPEQDMNVINAAIEAKQEEWSKNRNHPRLGTKMLQYLSMTDKIRSVMSDDELRMAEALAARKAAYEPLDRQLAVVCQKKKITSAEIDFLSKKYKLSRDKILARVPKNVEISDQKKQKAEPRLDTVIIRKIKDNLEIIKKKNLYDFLGADLKTPCDSLSRLADEIYSVYAKKPKNAENEAMCTLAGVCRSQLSEPQKRELYDRYLRESRLDVIKEAIDFAAADGEVNQAESQEIIRQIMAEGYDYGAAVEALKGHCAKKKYFLVLPADDGANGIALRRCGACGANVELSDNVRTCTSCGAPLFIECPSCKTLNRTSNNNCLKCGFSIKNMFMADGELAAAKKFIDDMSFDRADEALAKADRFYPNRRETAELRKKLDNIRAETETYKRELDRSVEQKHFAAAYEQYIKLTDRLDGYHNAELENRIKTAIKSARELAERARTCNDERQAVDLCVRAMDLCADCNGAKNILLGFELKPAANITVTASGMVNTISWSRSGSYGKVTYKLVKKAYEPPKNECDGLVLCEIDGVSFTDRDTVCAEPTYYAVFAQRGGIVSSACAANAPAYNFCEPQGVKAEACEQSVILSWTLPEGAAKAQVERADGFIPGDDGGNKPVQEFDIEGNTLTDSGLINGKQYFYRVYAVYAVGKRLMRSEGITVKAVPNLKPKPIKNVMLRREENGIYSLSFAKPERGDVILYCAEQGGLYEENDTVTAAEAEGRLKRLPICGQSEGNISFKADNISDILYIYPAVALGQTLAIGKVITASCAGGFESTAKPKFTSDKLYIELEWPKNADAALVLYSFEGYPTSPYDSSAMREFVTKRSYETQTAAIIRNIQKRNYYITVFAVYKNGNQAIYSDGLNIFAANEGAIEIRYAVRHKRTLLGKIKKIWLEVSCTVPLNELPAMRLVKKANILPLNKNDGTVVLTTDFKTAVNKEAIFFEDSMPTKTTCYKLFFSDDSNYERYKITTADISGLTIVR